MCHYEIAMALTFGEWLRSKRGMQGEPGFITQDELARRMNVARTFVVQLESPRHATPTYPTRKKIHHALGTTEEELITLGIISPRGARPEPRQVLRESSPSLPAADAFIRCRGIGGRGGVFSATPRPTLRRGVRESRRHHLSDRQGGEVIQP